MFILAVPILFDIAAFDKSSEQKLAFSWNGNQAFSNRLRIYKNSDSTLVYDQTQSSMQLYHTLAANTDGLLNGTQYRATIAVLDKDNTESAPSSPVLFYCYTKPTFLLNISENQIINNSMFVAEITYNQIEDEPLKEFEINLFDSGMNQIFTSSTLYPSITKSAILSSLQDDTLYYVAASGVTLENTKLETGNIPFSVRYSTPTVFTKVELQNLSDSGQIKIRSNMISIDGKSNPSPPTYIDNEEVDLTQPDSYVIFDEGYKIRDNFTMKKIYSNITSYPAVIDTFSNGVDSIVLTMMKGRFESDTADKIYCVLSVNNGLLNYRICSNKIFQPSDTQKCRVVCQKIHDLYNIQISVVT